MISISKQTPCLYTIRKWFFGSTFIYVILLYSALSRELSFFVEDEVIKEVDYTEIDLIGDLSDTIRIEDKILFTVRNHFDNYFNGVVNLKTKYNQLTDTCTK